MDQKEIDALLKGNFSELKEFSRKQEKIVEKLNQETKKNQTEGQVIGQLSRVTEESEQGTNMVMNYLENILTILNKQKGFLSSRKSDINENKQAEEIYKFFEDTSLIIEDLVFSAMDAFQFQDINRQKLLKVMHVLAQLNDYLNELLGTPEKRTHFGKNIDQKTLIKDEKKEEIDRLVKNFHLPDSPEKIDSR